jgi:hypothetical protein
MKITDSEVIRNAEQELLDGIIADLDWSVIEKIIKEKHHLDIEEDVAFRKGDLVALGNKVGYKLDFDVRLTLSILLDREGNYISTGTGKSSEDLSSDIEETPDIEASGQQEKTRGEDAEEADYEAALMAMGEGESIEPPGTTEI